MRIKNIIWLLTTTLLLVSVKAVADDDADLLISRANRLFSPLPQTMPGSENDTPELIELGKTLF